MKLKNFTICMLAVILITTGCNKAAKEAIADFKAESQKIADEFKANTSAEGIKRDAYMAFRKDKETKLEALLVKHEAIKSDELDLLRIRTLSELRKSEDAQKIIDTYEDSSSPFKSQIMLEKVDLMIAKREYENAFNLFKGIETTLPADKHLYGAYLNFTFYGTTDDVKKEYAEKFLAVPEMPESLSQYTHYVYEQLADIEKSAGNYDEASSIITSGLLKATDDNAKASLYNAMSSLSQEKGNMEEAVKILEDAILELKDPKAVEGIKAQLKSLKLIGAKAPELVAETWLNGKKKTLAKLKGKVVIVDFWATWCGPCRQVIPVLVESYEKYKDQGLEIIGFTRIYGRYSDDQTNKGAVEKDEEIKLTGEFLERFNIKYPIAIADKQNVFEEYGVRGIPTLFFIDKKGNIHEFEVGSGGADKIPAKIEKLLSE